MTKKIMAKAKTIHIDAIGKAICESIFICGIYNKARAGRERLIIIKLNALYASLGKDLTLCKRMPVKKHIIIRIIFAIE